MTVDTKVEYVLVASLMDGSPVILRRDTDPARIQPKAKTRQAWDTLSVQRIQTTREVTVIKAWRKGVEAND